MDPEANSTNPNTRPKGWWRTVLTLSFQSLGVVFGSMSTSPLYVYKSIFAENIKHSPSNDEIFGVLSFVFWTLTLVPLIKYVFIVLCADDHGEGGTFALYSLLYRHAKFGLLPNHQLRDDELTAYKKHDGGHLTDEGSSSTAGNGVQYESNVKKLLHNMLLLLALLGTCMLIGDGVLTPAISVFSAISGMEVSVSRERHKYVEVPVTCAVLIFLFCLQRYGTHKIGFLFAPIVALWLLTISIIGVYNIFYWNPLICKALNPSYIYKLLTKTQKDSWIALSGVLLCITGSEAMFADLGHFSHLSIKLAFTCAVYPSLILAYMGQAAFLSKHHAIERHCGIGFYISVPEHLRWPVMVIALLAAVVGSQAIITATFSIIRQCMALGCFPRVKIVHTSSKVHGQIYIPEINWILMILCLAVTVGFRDIKHMANASGLAVITVMLVTTCLMSLVMFLCWRKSVLLAICFFFLFGFIEGTYFAFYLVKVLEGAWVPILIAFIFMVAMYVWHYGMQKRYEYDAENKLSISDVVGLSSFLGGIVRVRGIGLVYTELMSGIPSLFSHFVINLPAIHQVVIFLCIKSVPVPHVNHQERFLVGRVGQREHFMYRCIARYGYREIHQDDHVFERDLVSAIAWFISSETHGEEHLRLEQPDANAEERMSVVSAESEILQEEDASDIPGPSSTPQGEITEMHSMDGGVRPRKRVRFVLPEHPTAAQVQEELDHLARAREEGTAYIHGHCYIRAKNGSGWLKSLAINYLYDFMRRNSRGPTLAVSIPHASTLEVTMLYEV